MAEREVKEAEGSGKGRADKKALKQLRRESKDYLKEVQGLLKRYRKRMQKDKVAVVEEAVAALQAAIKADDFEQMGSTLKKLEGLVEKHLGFARRSPSLEYALSIGKALAVALLLRLFVIEAFKIPSGSMIPTLLIGDHIFVNKLSYGLRLPVVNWEPFHWGGYERGEIIVFVNPQDDGRPFLERRDYIKRIVGLPGDTIEVRNEVVYVNGVPQPREKVEDEFAYFDREGDDGPWHGLEAELWKEKLFHPDGTVSVTHDVIRHPNRGHLAFEGPFVVPENHLFMMGDNRDNSADSRAGGWYVPFGHVKGRAMIIWLSLGKPGLWFWGETGIRFERFFKLVR